MGTCQVTHSVAAEVRLRRAAEWLVEQAGSAGCLVVAPSRGAADDFVRDLAAAGQAWFGVHRATPRLLALELATPLLAARRRLPVTTLGLQALAARAAAEVHGDLTYLDAVVEYPGFPRALRRTLTELGDFGASPDLLESSGPAGADLVKLWTRFVEELDRPRDWDGQTAAFADLALIFRTATEALDAGTALLGRPLLLLDVVPETPAEEVFWRLLAARLPAVFATAPSADPGLAPLAEALEVEAVALDDPSAPPAGRLAALRRRVFETESAAEPVPDDGSLEIIAAPGEGREAVEIARRAHELAAEGVPFDRMAVLLRDPASYLGLVEDALDRADIPAWFTRGTVRPDPAGRAFLALLECALEQLAASRFAEYLSLGQVPPVQASGAPPEREVPWVEPEGEQLVFKTVLAGPAGQQPGPDVAAGDDDLDADPEPDDADAAPVVAGNLRAPRHWERLLVDAAVVGGRDRWARRLSGLREELRERLTRLEDDDEGARAHLERQIEDLGHLERYALPLIEDLGALPARADWGDWIRQLRRLAARSLRDPERVLRVLAELEPMDKVEEVDLADVVRVLEERLTFLRSDPQGHRYGRLFVGTIEEARGRAFDVVFLPGLAEGKFPRRAAEDPLLLDALRDDIDPRLPTRDDRIERERLLLRVAAGAARKRLVVSYPTLDVVQGRARVPSFYALDVIRAAEGVVPTSDALDERARSRSRLLVGWPAPRDCELAIDEAEYDIAYLEPLLRRDGAAQEGQARFLLERNEHLARSLRVRHMRWRKTFSKADGVVNPSAGAATALQAQRLDQRSYSPTALQTFASCPYKFVLYAMHRLRPRDEIAPLEQMDPLTRGSLFHDVQYHLLLRLRDEGALPVTADDLGTVTRLADEVLDRVAADYAERLAPAIERVWNDEVEGLRTDLRGWIRKVAETPDGWVPTYFEFSFGLGQQAGRDPDSHRDEAMVLDGYRLRGSIDLVEHDPETDRWRVTDHKTGKAYWKQYLAVGGGEVLQPLLYALAAEHHLDATIESGRLFYCTRRGGFEERVVKLDDDNRSKVRQVLGLVDSAVAEGFLPAAPRERACDFCDYRLVCGPYEQTRVGNKRPEALTKLRWLREAP